MFLDRTDIRIIEEMSENARTHLKPVAEKAGVSIQTVSSRLKGLEKSLGLHYSLEFDLESIGMRSEHFVKIKFKEDPSQDILKHALLHPAIQLACRTNGDFDLFLWVVTATLKEFASDVEPKIREELGDFISDWTAHPVTSKRAGFLPANRELIEFSSVPKSRRRTLQILNDNSRIPVTELSEQLAVTEPTAEYHLQKSRQFITRFTSFFEGKGEFSHTIRIIQISGKKQALRDEGKKITSAYLNSNPRLFNRLVCASGISGGADVILIETASSLEDGNEITDSLFNESKIIGKHYSAQVSKMLKGAIPIRKTNLSKETRFLISPAEIAD